MAVKTAIAPSNMRPLAPAKPGQSSGQKLQKNSQSSVGSTGHRRIAPAKSSQVSIQPRPLKPLLAAKDTKNPVSIKPSSSAAWQPPKTNPAPKHPATEPNKAEKHTINERVATSRPPLRRAESHSSDLSDSSSEDSSLGDTSPTSSSSNLLLGDSTSLKDPDLDPTISSIISHVQPKKEWILPARAKPGRKPSDIEPPTKRKAQNRASQRAFRERRQSYVASLESKVAEYERRGAGLSLELQRAARRLKEENDILRGENTRLRAQIHRLERGESAESSSRMAAIDVATLAGGGSTGFERNALFTDTGSGLPISSILTESKSSTNGPSSAWSQGDEKDCGFCTREECVCSGDGVLDFTAGETLEETQVKQPEKKLNESVRKLSSDTGILSKPNTLSSLSLHRPSSHKPKLWYTEPSNRSPTHTAIRASYQQSGVQICPTVRDRWSALHASSKRLSSLPGTSTSSGVHGCLHSSPSANRSLDSSSLRPLQGHYRMSSRQQFQPTAIRPKQKLWPVYSGSVTAPQPSPRRASDVGIRSVSSVKVFRMRKQPYGAAPPVCSGDPSDCQACATDPALAAFCRAVSAHLEENHGSEGKHNASNGPVMLDAGNALPLRRSRRQTIDSTVLPVRLPFKRTRSGTIVESEHRMSEILSPQSLYTNDGPSNRPSLWKVSHSYGMRPSMSAERGQDATRPQLQHKATVESIPEAWKRIKQHPSFAHWQEQKGGLDLLADVVARRSSSDSEDEEEENSEITKKQENDDQPKTQVKSEDQQHSNTTPKLMPPLESPVQIGQGVNKAQDKGSDDEDLAANAKRRRLYVERQSVDNVLALMDRGSPSGREDDSSCACPLSKIL